MPPDYGRQIALRSTVSVAWLPSVSETVIVVDCPNVPVPVTVNGPVDVDGDTVAIDVLLLTAVKFPA